MIQDAESHCLSDVVSEPLCDSTDTTALDVQVRVVNVDVVGHVPPKELLGIRTDRKEPLTLQQASRE